MSAVGIWQLMGAALGHMAKGHLPPPDLLKALISKGLGLGIVAGSTLVKLPQVVNVVRARSAEGLNPLSFELETLGLVIAATYGVMLRLPFSAFGEVVALLLQNLVLMVMIYHFQRRSVGRTLALLAVLGGWGALLSTGALTRAHITALYDFNNVLLVAARVPQIVQSQASRSTGQLSIITYSLNVAGSAARIFTSVQERAGAAMLRGAVISTCLNAIMVAQIVAFGGAKKNKRD